MHRRTVRNGRQTFSFSGPPPAWAIGPRLCVGFWRRSGGAIRFGHILPAYPPPFALGRHVYFPPAPLPRKRGTGDVPGSERGGSL